MSQFGVKDKNKVKIEDKIEDFNEKSIFRNPDDLFDFIVKNENLKNAFVEEIREIVEIMKNILYNPPYNILFGRINLMDIKPDENIKLSGKNITQAFYEGFGLELLNENNQN